jgi:hypothetical protein
MGVQFVRILDLMNGSSGDFVRLDSAARPPAGAVSEASPTSGYLLSHAPNDAFIAVNRLVDSGETVYWTRPDGTNFIAARSGTRAKLQRLANDLGLRFDAVAAAPTGERFLLRPVRLGLWDKPGGSVSSGWARLILENFDFRYKLVDADALRAGNLSRQFDVIVLAGDGLPSQTAALTRFVDEGGTILAIDNSTTIASQSSLPAALPIEDALVEQIAGGGSQRLPASKFYVPGSILTARVDKTNPLTFGLPDRVDLYFDHSPTYRLKDNSDSVAKRVAWFDTDKPLRSGWAWGQEHLKDTIAVLEAREGKGRIILFGPDILFRAQSHGTFKLLFNAIYLSRAEAQ